jgi:hypothetical protein
LILNDPPGAAVWGMLADVERTPPVRRPARSEARGLGADAVGMVEMVAMEQLEGKLGDRKWVALKEGLLGGWMTIEQCNLEKVATVEARLK